MNEELNVNKELLRKFLVCCEAMEINSKEFIEEYMVECIEGTRDALSEYAVIFEN